MIAKIAEAHDCSEEDFFAMKSTAMVEAVALPGLRPSIRDGRDRDAVMACVRTVAEKASVPSGLDPQRVLQHANLVAAARFRPSRPAQTSTSIARPRTVRAAAATIARSAPA